MIRAVVAILLCVGLLGLQTSPQEKTKNANSPAPPDQASAVREFLSQYVSTFDKGQCDAAAAMWTPNCVYVDRETGARTEGRAAVKADLERVFKENPGARLSLNVTQIRFVRPEVASVEGRATVSYANAEPTTTEFSTILVRNDAKWLIDSVQETSVPSPSSPSNALRELEWLLGDWVDDSPGIKVECSVQWAANRSFLVRSYKVERENEEPWEGSQIIGWDPRNKEIRSWTFDSDGSFDEGSWSRHGDTWNVSLSRTLENGGIASATQVIKKTGPDSYTVQMVGREVNGDPVPSSEVLKVVRAFKKPGETK
jgi:uncharacterized protein (TIGR02246 family)